MTASYTINENLCVECGQCRRFCPIAGAIVIDERYQHVVVADLCSGCGLCEAFCPVEGALTIAERAPFTPARRLTLRRVVWRSLWRYHEHPLMGPLTLNARESLRSARQRERRQTPAPVYAS